MLLMFSRDFGDIYIAMLVLWGFFFFKDILISDKKITFPIERTAGGRVQSFLLALVFYAVFLAFTTIMMNLFSPGTLQSTGIFAQAIEVVKLQSTGMLQASEPILQNSKILMVIGWAFLIPVVETVLFNGRMFEALYDGLRKKGVNVHQFGVAIITLILFIGAISTIYHLTSKNLASVPLMITFMFFTLSGYLVWWKKQLREAIFMHIIGNFIAVLAVIGIAAQATMG